MNVPRLQADIEGGIGSVSFPPGWNALPPLTRVDLLQDWLQELSNAYTAAYYQTWPMLAPRGVEPGSVRDH